jgi:hypothetical protein
VTGCHVCEAIEHADDSNLANLLRYFSRRCNDLTVQNLELRLQIAEGPRHRVRELELTVERLNRKIAELNGRRR